MFLGSKKLKLVCRPPYYILIQEVGRHQVADFGIRVRCGGGRPTDASYQPRGVFIMKDATKSRHLDPVGYSTDARQQQFAGFKHSCPTSSRFKWRTAISTRVVLVQAFVYFSN